MNADKRNNSTVGNAGLFYCCYELARQGWNVLPTSRNAKGVDVVVYSSDGKKFRSVQVKTLSKKAPVPLGEKPTYDMAQFVIVCRLARDEQLPEVFVMTPAEVDKVRHQGDPKKSKAGKTSFWLQPKGYEPHLNCWKKLDSEV